MNYTGTVGGGVGYKASFGLNLFSVLALTWSPGASPGEGRLGQSPWEQEVTLQVTFS